MALKGTSSPIRVETNLHGLGFVLRSAVCEWLLLFLLLLDAAFSYCLTKFAEYCGLQLPCLFCSRLDHVFGNEKPDFYNNLLCSHHKSEISSLVMCHNHHKLADIHAMCEECLLSVAKTGINEETWKFLAKPLNPDSLVTKSCSCCSKAWTTRPYIQKLVYSTPSPSVLKPDLPLPKSPQHRRLNRQEGLKKRKDRFSVSTTPLVLGNIDYDVLSRMGYTEVKITSDSDSDFPLSDDENLFQQSSEFQGLELEKGETTTPTFLPSGGTLRYSLTDIDWRQIHKKTSPELSEFTLLDDIPLTTGAPDSSAAVSTNEAGRSSLLKKFGGSSLADYGHKTASLPVNFQFALNKSKENRLDSKGKGNIEHASAVSKWESIDLNGTKPVIEVMPADRDEVKTFSSSLEHQNRDFYVTGFSEEPSSSKTAFSHQNSSVDHNTTVNGRVDKPQMFESHDLAESRVLSKFPSIERSPSLESREGSVERIEGEKNMVDKLRQENEHAKKRISDLYKELEAERSAAAIAANQAMAMITKLQEEKAALHMEALQYLRMMEEQAEYDVDELEKANDVIADKEKEIQDLEAELDFFRIKYPEDFPEEPDINEMDLEDVQSSYMDTVESERS